MKYSEDGSRGGCEARFLLSCRLVCPGLWRIIPDLIFNKPYAKAGSHN